ncbi:hypothetical protein [Sphingomicrobium arenosum]|uniref:hypothetical protein n=1 Tax=Sphingomicrobium arenosum TaxID=2233861 RepID=UPI00223F0268|nr:hypothetical protein [Sphingomicrobium arenosum]
MITGLFFVLLIAALGMVARHVAEAEGGKILDALAGRSRPEPATPARVVTISWEHQAPRAPMPRAAAA